MNWNRVVSDKFAVGAGFRLDRDVFKDPNDFRQLNSQVRVTANAAYAFQLSEWQLIAGAQLGFGQRKNESESGGSTNESKDDLFSARFRLSSPIQLYQSDLFLVPNAGYRYSTKSGENQDINTGTIFFGLDMNVSIPCDSWWYDEDVDLDRDNRYTPGTQMWSSGTKLRVNLGDVTNKFSGGGQSDENRNRVTGRVNYFYYPLDDFAIGAKAGFNSDTRSQKDSDFKVTNTSLSFMPMLRWHPLKTGCWNDVYVEGGGGFISSKNTTKGGSSSESKQNTVAADGGIGTFIGLAQDFYLNPSVRYVWTSTKDPDDSDDLKLEETGVQVEVQLTYSF